MGMPGIWIPGGILGGAATFPSVRGSVQLSNQVSGTSFAPTIPTHSAGNLLLVFLAYARDDNVDAVAATVTASGGWTQKAQIVNTHTDHNSQGRGGLALFTRTATTGSHTITITNSNDSGICAIVYVIQGGTSIEASIATGNDPPSLTPSWGIDFNYWMVASENCATVPGVGPTGFGNAFTTSGGHAAIATLDKNEVVATQDPSAFSGGNADSRAVLTAVVRP